MLGKGSRQTFAPIFAAHARSFSSHLNVSAGVAGTKQVYRTMVKLHTSNT